MLPLFQRYPIIKIIIYKCNYLGLLKVVDSSQVSHLNFLDAEQSSGKNCVYFDFFILLKFQIISLDFEQYRKNRIFNGRHCLGSYRPSRLSTSNEILKYVIFYFSNSYR